jgi:hypothetical protein
MKLALRGSGVYALHAIYTNKLKIMLIALVTFGLLAVFVAYLSLSKAKRNNMTMTEAPEKRQQARDIYKKTGSIKRTAKTMKESKSTVRKWISDLIASNPLNSRNNFQRNLRRQNKTSNPKPSVLKEKGYSGTIHSKSRVPQRAKNPSKIVTSDKGTFEVDRSDVWGWYLVPVEDPRRRSLTLQEINGVKLPDDFCKIPSDLWISWVDLCFHYCPEEKSPDPELEVQTLLCRKEGDPSQWRMLVPNQAVSGISVQSEVKDCIDLMTGERFDYFPPTGWMHAGSSHSHNTMKSFFSETDDRSELSVPGIHIVVGDIDKKKGTYTYKASIVVRRLRKHTDFHDIVDADADSVPDEITFHPDVLKYIYKKYVFLKGGPSMKPRVVRGTPSRPRFDDDDDYSCFTIPTAAFKTPPPPEPIKINPNQDFIDDELYLD